MIFLFMFHLKKKFIIKRDNAATKVKFTFKILKIQTKNKIFSVLINIFHQILFYNNGIKLN